MSRGAEEQPARQGGELLVLPPGRANGFAQVRDAAFELIRRDAERGCGAG